MPLQKSDSLSNLSLSNRYSSNFANEFCREKGFVSADGFIMKYFAPSLRTVGLNVSIGGFAKAAGSYRFTDITCVRPLIK